jgi:hypothetical protein
MTQEIKQRLDSVADQALGAVDLWPGVERRTLRGLRRARWMPASRLGWAAVAAVAVVLLGSAAYAAAPLLTDVYRINPTWNPAAGDSSYPVQVTQTIDGCTVTLEQVFIDQERILIGVSGTGPSEMSLGPTNVTLHTGDGQTLPWVDGAGHGDLGAAAWVLAFDATSLEELPDLLTLDLSLSISAIPVDEAHPSPATPEHASDQSLEVVLSPIEASVFGPFRFTVSVPTAEATR